MLIIITILQFYFYIIHYKVKPTHFSGSISSLAKQYTVRQNRKIGKVTQVFIPGSITIQFFISSASLWELVSPLKKKQSKHCLHYNSYFYTIHYKVKPAYFSSSILQGLPNSHFANRKAISKITGKSEAVFRKIVKLVIRIIVKF